MIRKLREYWRRFELRVQRIEPPQLRRLVVGVMGSTVLMLGLGMLVLPGPASIVIPAGLAILALEFGWAKYWLNRVKTMTAQAAQKVAPKKFRRAPAKAARGGDGSSHPELGIGKTRGK